MGFDRPHLAMPPDPRGTSTGRFPTLRAAAFEPAAVSTATHGGEWSATVEGWDVLAKCMAPARPASAGTAWACQGLRTLPSPREWAASSSATDSKSSAAAPWKYGVVAAALEHEVEHPSVRLLGFNGLAELGSHAEVDKGKVDLHFVRGGIGESVSTSASAASSLSMHVCT